MYQERLQQFFEANEIEDAGKQRAILLSVCGRKTYQLLRNLTTPDKPADKTFDDLCALLRNHFAPAPSEIVQRYRFHSRNRQPGQSISSFVAELRKLSEHCNFGLTLDTMIRHRLVCGVQYERIQRRLLAETGQLTLKKAVEVAIGIDTASRDVAEVRSGPTTLSSSVNKVSSSGKRQPSAC